MSEGDKQRMGRADDKSQRRQTRSRRRWLLWAPIIAAAVCITALIMIECVPIFISLPIYPPADFYGVSDWTETTYAVRVQPLGRSYVLRRAGGFSNGDQGTQNWETIVGSFDKKLAGYGWMRDQSYAPCETYLAEATFIESGQGGYIHYRRRGYEASQEEYSEDLICLAVWMTAENPDGTPRNFRIVLLTARPSLLERLGSLL